MRGENCFKGVEAGKQVGDICKKCHNPIGSILKRFKIKVLVSDSLEQAYFTLFENSAPYFLNKSASELKKEVEESDDPNGLPQSFEDLLERECLFRVEVNERFNIELRKQVYTVKSVTENVDLMERFTSITGINEVASRLNFDEEDVLVNKDKRVGFDLETSEDSSSTFITPLKRPLNYTDEDTQHSAAKASKS